MRNETGVAERLESWKQIAAYFGRSERTVRRWALSDGMPVHRTAMGSRTSVYAFVDELKDWERSRNVAAPLISFVAAEPVEKRGPSIVAPLIAAGMALAMLVLTLRMAG